MLFLFSTLTDVPRNEDWGYNPSPRCIGQVNLLHQYLDLGSPPDSLTQVPLLENFWIRRYMNLGRSQEFHWGSFLGRTRRTSTLVFGGIKWKDWLKTDQSVKTIFFVIISGAGWTPKTAPLTTALLWTTPLQNPRFLYDWLSIGPNADSVKMLWCIHLLCLCVVFR